MADNADRLRELADKHGGMSPGMTSPDSTQAPLRASTGEPDERALRGDAGAVHDAAGGGVRGDEPVADEDGR